MKFSPASLLLVLCVGTSAASHLRRDLAAEYESSPKTKEGDTIGLALTGGAFTAGNIGGAIMRGFQQQVVTIDGKEMPAMEAFDFTSGLSGGNFPNIVYAFAQDTDSYTLLDADGISEPSLITKEELENGIPETSMFSRFTKSVWDLDSIPKAMLWSAIAEKDFWSSYVYLHFLEPFGIPKGKKIGGADKRGLEDYVTPRSDVKATPVVEFSMTGPVALYPEWIYQHSSVEIVEGLLAGRAHFEEVNEFQPLFEEQANKLKDLFGLGDLPPPQFRVLDNSAFLEVVKDSGYQMPVPFTGTPEEVGSSFPAGTMQFDDVFVTSEEGNFTLFDKPLDFVPFYVSPETVETECKNFSVEYLLALGTALLPILLQLNPLTSEILPEFFLEPLKLDVPSADGNKRTMAFADGGYNDNTGIPALVQRKVRNIFIVTSVTPDQFGFTQAIADPIVYAFGSLNHYFGVNDVNSLSAQRFQAGIDFTNHVFDLFSNGENQLLKLTNNLKSLQEAGNPMITTLEDLTVVENPFWGTEAGEKVSLTVIHAFGVPKKFSDQVPRDVAPPPEGRDFTENGFFTNEDLAYVPNLVHSSDALISVDIPGTDINIVNFTLPQMEFALNPKGARMTQILCSWMVKEAWDGLEGADGETKFGGFRKIFEKSDGENEE